MPPDLIRDLLVQLAVILVAARLGAWLFTRLGQPEVVGEIVAGLMLGPTVLGRFDLPLLSAQSFSETGVLLQALSELGLVLFMFLVGLTMIGSVAKPSWERSWAVACQPDYAA